MGMKKAACNASGDRDQIGLIGKDFDVAGAGEFGKIDWASVADAASRGLVGGN